MAVIINHTIFLRDTDNELIPLSEIPYASEDIFQALIEHFPDILAGDQICPENPLRWILISREIGVPSEENGVNQWFLDHLFIDQNGVPTLVEVKRSTDTRIRREVVGQMLDYAANATEYWNISDLREMYEVEGQSLEQAFGFNEEQIEAFWTNVGNNLKLGKIRLLFVADFIPKTLLRIIEFLNNQMINTEVLGLEIKQYLSGNNRQILVPTIVGKTLLAGDVKKSSKKEWDNDSFLEDIARVGGTQLSRLAEKVMASLRSIGCRIWFGHGAKHASIVAMCDNKYGGTPIVNIYPWLKGVHLEIDFQYYKKPFDTPQSRLILKEKLETALCIVIPNDKLTKRPSTSFDVLLDPQKYDAFFNVLSFIVQNLKQEE